MLMTYVSLCLFSFLYVSVHFPEITIVNGKQIMLFYELNTIQNM